MKYHTTVSKKTLTKLLELENTGSPGIAATETSRQVLILEPKDYKIGIAPDPPDERGDKEVHRR
jgi:hypothetical protein